MVGKNSPFTSCEMPPSASELMRVLSSPYWSRNVSGEVEVVLLPGTVPSGSCHSPKGKRTTLLQRNVHQNHIQKSPPALG